MNYNSETPMIVLRLRYAYINEFIGLCEEGSQLSKLIDWDEYDGNDTFQDVLQEYIDEGGDLDLITGWDAELPCDEDYDDEDYDDPWNTCPNNHFGFGDEHCGWPDSRDYEDAENNTYYDNAEDFDIYIE